LELVESIPSSEVTIGPKSSLRVAMARLEQSARQIVLVVDDFGRLGGVVTDGDVRRALLLGSTLDDSVVEAMNRNFRFVRSGYELSLVGSLMESQGIRHLPVVDSVGRPVEVLIASYGRSSPGRANQVVIMAGGRGSRLRPLTDEIPKPMLTVSGVPILELIIRGYASQGFRNFTIVTGYLSERVEEHFADGSGFGVHISYFREDEPLGTAGALTKAVSSNGEPVVLSNADVLSSIDLGSMIDAHVAGGFALTIATRLERIKVPYGLLELNSSKVTAWREKPELPLPVSAGIYVVDASSLSYLDDGYADVPDLVQRLLGAGQPVGAHKFEGLWIDVGTHDTLRAAAELGSIMVGEGVSR